MFLGVLLMRGAGVPGNVAGLQAGWLLVGLAVAWVIATTPRRLLERAAVRLGCLSIAALIATAIFGAPMASAARWMTLGSVRVQTSLLVLPCIAVALATAFARGSGRLAFGLAVAAQLALIAQPDGATSVLVAVAAITAAIGAGTLRWRSIAWMGAALAAGAVVALVRDPHIPTVAHVEGVFSLPGSALLKLAALAALLLVPAYPIAVAFRARRSEGPVRAGALALAATSLASIAIPAFGPYPVPLVGYGGSGVMACMIGLAFVLAHEPEADDSPHAS